MRRHGGVLVLHCFGYPARHAGEVGSYAHCLELDLVVWRPNSVQARQALGEQIGGYLDLLRETVGGAGDLRGLLPRRAPLSVQLKYVLVVFIVKALRARQRFRETFVFKERVEIETLMRAA